METAGVHFGNVRALRRLRVLVAARDRRFLRVAGFLLVRSGFDVESTPRPHDLLELVDRHIPDIVVLDGTDSLAEAARSVAVLEGIHPHVTVVVVSDDDGSARPANLEVFPKWKSFDQLVLQLEAMHLGASPIRPVSGS
jgi:DNA-binding NtrC family response regulator